MYFFSYFYYYKQKLVIVHPRWRVNNSWYFWRSRFNNERFTFKFSVYVFALVIFTRFMRSDCIKWTFLSSIYISYYTIPDRRVILILLVLFASEEPLRHFTYINFRRRKPESWVSPRWFPWKPLAHVYKPKIIAHTQRCTAVRNVLVRANRTSNIS